MDCPRLFRGLRIAVSAVCGILCVLLIALWVRSYSWNDVFACPAGGTRFHLQSLCGRIVFGKADNSVSFTQRVTESLCRIAHKDSNVLGFGYLRARFGNDFWVTTPHWFLVSTFATLAAAPWIPWSKRFRLRTLLITMTLLAVALGPIIAFGHS